MLTEEGVYANVKPIREYPLGLIPFDCDILSMELPCFSECVVHGEKSALFHAARAMIDMQALFGVAENVYAKGHLACETLKLMSRLRDEEHSTVGKGQEETMAPEIHSILILDRGCDLVSPLCTPLTYEGLVDEIIGIENAFVMFDAEGTGKKQPVPLNSNDPLYEEVRDYNIGVLLPRLSERATELAGHENSRDNLDSLDEIHGFVKSLPTLQADKRALKLHIDLCEHLQKTTTTRTFRELWQSEQSMIEGRANQTFVEDCIAKEESPVQILRLLCLQSLCCGGIRGAKYNELRREVLQTYGYDYIYTLDNFERAGMLRKQSLWDWRAISKAFRLIVDAPKVTDPDDMAYVTSGYAPLSARIVEQFCSKGWSSMSAQLKLLPGPSMEERQRETKVDSRQGAGEGKQKVLFVFVVGGITSAEISAMRLINKRKGGEWTVLIGSTNLTSGRKFCSELVEDSDSGEHGRQGNRER